MNLSPYLASVCLCASSLCVATPLQTHEEYSVAILELLSLTEQSLNQCVDEQSIQEQLPTLKDISEQLNNLLEERKALPAPNMADYSAINTNLADFHTIWSAIKQHIVRLTQEGIYSEELLNTLKLKA